VPAADGLIYLVEDDDAVRDALSLLLRAAGREVRAFASAEEFLANYRPLDVACLVVDVRLPRMNGLELQQALGRDGRAPPVVLITGHGDVPMAAQAFKAGAIDFIQKPVDADALLKSIDNALDRAALAAEGRVWKADLEARLGALSARERQVFDHVVAGVTNKSIARDLDISPRTVEVYRRRVMEKMRVGTLADLVRAADTLGISPSSPHATRTTGENSR
jgi:FixJ family two-component response regulator